MSYKQEYIVEQKITLYPMGEIAGFRVRPGLHEVDGAMAFTYGVNFTIHTHNGTGCELLLFHSGEEEPYAVLPFPEEYKIGDVYSMIVLDLKPEDFEYAYRVGGPYNRKKGLLFDRRNILLDPYAKAVAGQRDWGDRKRGSYHAHVVYDNFDWGDAPQSRTDLSDLIIYELHVRGFTQHESSGVRHRGTFAGLMEKIPYLKELGINAVELMPIFEFDENLTARKYNGKTLLDYWGYNTVSFFAPNTSYIATDARNEEGRELKFLIKELHDNGIEVILDVVFNHTAEGNERGKVINFKGFDNNVYYMLTPEGNYFNFSGCGNTMNCNHPVVRRMIIDCLRHWTIDYRVDGFRFDLASILGRNEDGSPLNNPPLLQSLACDPILSNVKLIAEAWDAGGLYQVGSFPAHQRWAEWNGRYRDTLRSFLKGASWDAAGAAESIGGSEDLYGSIHNGENNYAGINSSVNFLTCHDGFTLYDLYSYNYKHNEDNGWNNTDGSDNNLSWNCGAEGETDDPEILSLRYRMIRNACAVLMCSRGAAMFLAGDEFGNTQYGNNNSYCQDNEISWLDWNRLAQNRSLFDFFRFMIAFRRSHPSVRHRLPDAVCGMESIRIFDVNGRASGIPQNASAFMVCFAGYDRETGRDDIVCLAVNVHWESAELHLPKLNRVGSWYLAANTSGNGFDDTCTFPQGREVRISDRFVMGPRSVAVFFVKTH